MRCFLLQKYENSTIYRTVYNVQPSQQTFQFASFNLALVKQNENENKKQLLKNVCSVSHWCKYRASHGHERSMDSHQIQPKWGCS